MGFNYLFGHLSGGARLPNDGSAFATSMICCCPSCPRPISVPSRDPALIGHSIRANPWTLPLFCMGDGTSWDQRLGTLNGVTHVKVANISDAANRPRPFGCLAPPKIWPHSPLSFLCVFAALREIFLSNLCHSLPVQSFPQLQLSAPA